MKPELLSSFHSCSTIDLRPFLGISGTVGRRDNMCVTDEGAPAPEFPPAVAVQVDRHHPRVLAFVSDVAPDDPCLRHLVLPALWKGERQLA